MTPEDEQEALALLTAVRHELRRISTWIIAIGVLLIIWLILSLGHGRV